MPFTDPSPLGDFFYSFLSMLFEGAPYIFMGALIAGFIDAYLPQKAIERLLPKAAIPAIVVSAFLGLPFPVCECAIVPVIRRLVQKGLPVACAVTYMLASPIVNPITAASTMQAYFDPEIGWAASVAMTGGRIGLGILITIAVGVAIHKISPAKILLETILKRRADEEAEESRKAAMVVPEKAPSGTKLIRAMRSTQHDFIDTAMYFTIGIAITAVFNTQLNKEFIQGLVGKEFFAIPAMQALAFVLSLCSTSDAFVAVNLKVLSQSSQLAFLVFGPMVDVKLLFMYATIFRKQFIAYLVAGLFFLTGIASYLYFQIIG